MILNTYALLLAFIAILRLLVGMGVMVLGALAARASGMVRDVEERRMLEDRNYLAILLTLLLGVLNLVSWPLLYLLLQSYVAEWPGVMCIYGVTQIGKDGHGWSRFLPNLLTLLQLGKPLLIFVSGAWFVIYLVNRQTRTGPLLPRLFLLVSLVGVFAVLDASTELAYIAIPKKEEMPSGGCCTVAFEQAAAERFLPTGLTSDISPTSITLGWFASNLLLLVALGWSVRRGAVPGSLTLAALILWGFVTLLVSGWFLVDVLAPTLLRLPYHHCPYDLVPQAPDAVVAVTLFLLGCLFLGWAGIAHWAGATPESAPLLPSMKRRLLLCSLVCHGAALVMGTLELVLA